MGLGSGVFGVLYRSKPAVGRAVTCVFLGIGKELALFGYLLHKGVAESVPQLRGKISLLLKTVFGRCFPGKLLARLGVESRLP